MYAVQRPFVLVECSQLQACENGALQFLGHHKLLIIWRGAQYKKTKTLRADLLAERITTFTYTHTQTHTHTYTHTNTNTERRIHMKKNILHVHLADTFMQKDLQKVHLS